MRASTSAGRGPFMTRSPVTATASGRARSTAARAASRAATLPWMSPKHGQAEAHRRTPSPGMMKLSRASQATSPSTLATPRPRPKRRPSLLHDDLQTERVAGLDEALEAALLDAGEQPDAVAEALLLGDVDGHRLGQRLHLQHAGHDRQPREVALEEPLRGGHALLAPM